jgi:hypothetical protein
MTDGGDNSTTSSASNDAPVGSGDYIVEPGDCIASISFANGHIWQTLWNDSGNAELKQKRKSPYLLVPGDRVTIPPIRLKQEPGATEQLHQFKLNGVPALVRIQILESPDAPPPGGPPPADQQSQEGAPLVIEEPPDDGEKLQPAANKPYKLFIDDVIGPPGQTDGKGMLKVQIMPDAQELLIRLEPGTERERELKFLLGQLNPPDTHSGQAQRLANLGFDLDPSGDDPDALEQALEDFQNSQGIKPTGQADAATLDKLKQIHGS